MSQAKELLNSIASPTAMQPTPMDPVEYIVIDNDRFIDVPDSLTRLGVQHDHNIETVTFRCPRFWDGHDMSKMKIYVNYLCSDGFKDKHLTENLQVDELTMTFDWTISANVTRVNGRISFLVCIVEVDLDGNEIRHWNSELNQQCSISSGLECDEIAIVNYPDIITQLLVRMDAVEDVCTPEAMQSYTQEWLDANGDQLLANIIAASEQGVADIKQTARKESDSLSMAVDNYVTNITQRGETALNAISQAEGEALRDVNDLGSQAVSNISTAATNAGLEIEAKKKSATDAIGDAQSTALASVTARGTSAVNAIGTAEENAATTITDARSAAITDIDTARSSAMTEVNNAEMDAAKTVSDKEQSALANIETREQQALEAIGEALEGVGGSTNGAVLYTPQELTDEQKAQARANIGVNESGSTDSAVLYTEQVLTDDQKAQARTNIGAVSVKEVEEMLGIEEELVASGDLVEFNFDVEPDTGLEVISKIHRDEAWGLSDKLVLHQVSGTNFVDFSSFLGGAGKVIEKNGLTATINADSTITISGTNESTDYNYIVNQYHFDGEESAKVYPAGTYTIPSGFMMTIRSARTYPAREDVPGATGNLSRTVTIPEPFRIISMAYAVGPGKTVDITLPLGLFRGNSIPETGYEYSGFLHTVTFDAPVYEGEFNWRTGELKDVDGNTVSYYDVPEIKSLPGTNYFWTCFGENTVSNRKDEGKVILRLNETAPEDTVPSICDFMFTPTTPEAAYGLYYAPFLPSGQFYGKEVPVMTTKGTLSVKDSDGVVKYSKYIEPMFNTRGVSDVLTHNGLEKKWSKKFYLTKEPVSVTNSPPPYSGPPETYVFVWEFDESEFANTGIPAKIHDIPMASPCFINNDKSENNVNTQVLWNGTAYPAFFSYNEETGKYTLTARGIVGSSIKHQLTAYSKVHFYYQLETPYSLPFTFAMGIDAGDTISFEADLADNQPYIDALSDFKNHNVDPSITAFIPRNVEDAMDGMNNAAKMLNTTDTATSGDATVQGYSWIGEGDGVTDYTVQIQSKLDELHKVSNGGTIHLGSGTYPISKSLIVYGNTQIVGNCRTVIEQRADNTHAIVANGSYISIKDLSIRLSGSCTSLTGCIYVNSDNTPSNAKYDNTLPENFYAQSLTFENIHMTGKYTFSYENGYGVISDAYDNYKGVGIYGDKGYFNFSHIENIKFNNLYAGIYGGGSSNYFNVSDISCRYGIYTIGALNTYFIDGHSYYEIDADGKHISMSDTIAYVENDTSSTYHLRCYDSQAFKSYIFLSSTTQHNKIDIQNSFSGGGSQSSGHSWNILQYYIVDHGWANTYNDRYKHTPYHIGNRTTTIAGSQHHELSDPVIQNALPGAGIWGNISSNVEFIGYGIELKDVCRYPSEKADVPGKAYVPYILSAVAPSEDNPIEIVIDYSNRPVHGLPNYFIQFYHSYVASDYVVSFDTTNTGVFDFVVPVTNNTNTTDYDNYPMVGGMYTSYRMKLSFTKALQIPNLKPLHGSAFDYNPDGLIGICNIGMTVNDYAGRSFLGECGGSLYGDVDMHQNTLKNLPAPVDSGDAVNKTYLEGLVNGKSVRSYGAKGDGSTNDTEWFQAALAENRVVRVPGGTYVLDGTLVIRENCCLELSQDTVLKFTQTTGNCIEMRGSAVLRGNHAIISAAFGLTGNVISIDTSLDGEPHNSIPPYQKADPMFKRQRFVYDVNIIKTNSSGFNRAEANGECSGTAIYMHCDGMASISWMWGIILSGIRIAGGFSYGIRAYNVDDPNEDPDNAWNHDMRIEAVIEGCEIGVSLENCNGAHLNVTIQPNVSNPGSVKYAKQGVVLRDCRYVDMMRSRIWDWHVAATGSEEYKHIALYGNCRGLLLDDFLVTEHPNIDIRDDIYTDTPSNFDTMTILQEPANKWFKSIDNVPYFYNGTGNRKLMLATERFSAEQAEFIHPANGYYTYDPNFINKAADVGYTNGKYMAENGAETSGNSTLTLSGYIPVSTGAKIIRIGGTGITFAESGCVISFYKADKTLLGAYPWYKLNYGDAWGNTVEDEIAAVAWDTTNTTHGRDGVFMRVSAKGDGANLVVTVDEPIDYAAIWHGEPKRLDESLYAQNVMLTSPNGKVFLLKVSDTGVITAEET